ncbi:unnamed protein product [Pleuronectes platessa]|uniref:Uncharacterized protein n=1 Tax=Pleuronectes platessa TaxID=8262 RepID=A0A9N7VBC0_PLEPL|nr:unnamed protein product [Pleuronectes platessa]
MANKAKHHCTKPTNAVRPERGKHISSKRLFVSQTHTHQNATEGSCELLLLSGSFILWNARLCLTLPFFVCHFLINTVSIPSPHSGPSLKLVTSPQRPHHSDFIRRQLQSRPRSKVLVREGS